MLKAIMGGLAAIPRGLNALLELKNEATGTRKVTIAAVLMITAALAGLSICGAFAISQGGGWAWIPRLFYALLVLGLETLAAVLFMRAMLAGDKRRAAVCFAVLPFLIWANVQNAKDGVHFIMKDRFAESGQTLSEKADLAKEEAATLATAQSAALAGSGAELERVRTEIAGLKAEQEELSSQSPEGIKKSQSRLIGQGHYFGKVDGIRDNLTEAAMRRRGEEITAQLKVLNQRETGFMAGQASPVQQATSDKRLEEIETRAKARAAAEAAWRLEVILWVSELARNLMLWAAATSVTAGLLVRAMARDEEIAEAEHAARLTKIKGAEAPAEPKTPPAPISEPVASPEPLAATVEPEPAPPIHPPPVTQEEAMPEPILSDAQRNGRAGGLAAGQNRKAARAKNERLILVPSLVARDAELTAAKLAAE